MHILRALHLPQGGSCAPRLSLYGAAAVGVPRPGLRTVACKRKTNDTIPPLPAACPERFIWETSDAGAWLRAKLGHHQAILAPVISWEKIPRITAYNTFLLGAILSSWATSRL